jgi:hypothetical protein
MDSRVFRCTRAGRPLMPGNLAAIDCATITRIMADTFERALSMKFQASVSSDIHRNGRRST